MIEVYISMDRSVDRVVVIDRLINIDRQQQRYIEINRVYIERDIIDRCISEDIVREYMYKDSYRI